MAADEERKIAEKAAKAERKRNEQIARRLANRSCPLLVFYTETFDPNATSKVSSGWTKSGCLGLDCLWWSQSDQECYILLACKKIITKDN